MKSFLESLAYESYDVGSGLLSLPGAKLMTGVVVFGGLYWYYKSRTK